MVITSFNLFKSVAIIGRIIYFSYSNILNSSDAWWTWPPHSAWLIFSGSEDIELYFGKIDVEILNLINTCDFCVKFWEKWIRLDPIAIVVALAWMCFLSIESGSNHLTVINCHTSDVRTWKVGDECCLTCFVKIFVIWCVKQLWCSFVFFSTKDYSLSKKPLRYDLYNPVRNKFFRILRQLLQSHFYHFLLYNKSNLM